VDKSVSLYCTIVVTCYFDVHAIGCFLQAWAQREQSLLNEVATLRQELRQLLSLQTQQQQQQQQRPHPAAAAAAAAVPDAASFAGPGAAASSSGGSADPAYSNSPAAGQ
jgi:hypothetical protein